MIIYKISSPYGEAHLNDYNTAVKSFWYTYPDSKTILPLVDQITPTSRIFSREGSGWFQIEAIEVKSEPQRLMPFKKV